MAEHGALPSAELLLTAVEQLQDRQLRHFESLDSKAGVVLGFAGAIAALTRDVQPLAGKAGLLCAVIAAGFAMWTFKPRGVSIFNAMELRRYVRAEARLTTLRLLDTQIEMTRRTSVEIEKKARSLRVALIMLMLSVTLTVGGTLLG